MALRTAAVRPAVRDRLARLTFRPVWVVFGAVAVVHLLGVSVPVTARYGAFLATVVLLGLPHGALDHLTLVRARGERATPRSIGRFSARYLGVGAAYAGAWLLAPSISFLSFVLLTWYHWGQGDRAHLTVLADAEHVAGRIGRLTVAVRGGLPMLVPLVAFPERYRSVLATVVGLFDASGSRWGDPLFRADVRLALGLGFGLLTALTLLAGLQEAGDTDAWRLDVAETALLWAFFLAVPPVLAIGLYFALWHSLRHLVRLAALDETATDAIERGADLRAVLRLARDATPMTVSALALFGSLALAVPNEPGTLVDFGGVYLVLLAVLTLPHVLVVRHLDRLQGVV